MKSELESAVETKKVFDTLTKDGGFKRFARMVRAAGFDDTLNGEGPFTVFAPTDEAFRKIPRGTYEALLGDRARLTEIITYHVVPGKLIIGVVMGLNSARTLQGEKIYINACNEVLINDAEVVRADIACSNGVIHGVDTVLLPTREPVVAGY